KWVRVRDIRQRETVIEPLIFFCIGLVIWILSQPIGFIILMSSIFYAFSYRAAYHRSDHFIMDKIDQMIMNEEMEDSFVEEADPDDTRGVRFFARRPTSKELRRKLAATFIGQEDDDVYVVK